MLKLKIMTRTQAKSSWKRTLIQHWPILFLFFLSTLYFLPYFVFPAFNLIDDGWSLSVARQLSAHVSVTQWLNILVEDEIGRLRPLYYLYFWLVTTIFGTQPLGFWIGQALTIFGTLWLSWKITFKLSGNKSLSLLPSILFLMIPAVSENTYRLGTAEPRQLLFILAALWWMLHLPQHRLTLKRAALGVILFWMALLTKETSLFFVPLYISFYILERLRGHLKNSGHLALLLVMTLSAVAFLLLIPESKAYSNSYQVTLQSLWLRVLQTRLNAANLLLPMTVALLATTIRAVFWLQLEPLKKIWHRLHHQLLIFLTFSFAFVIILPWEMLLERYFYLVSLFILMYITLEISSWRTEWPKLKKKLSPQRTLFSWLSCVVLGILIFGIFQGRGLTFWQMPWLAWTNLQGQFDTYQISYAVIKYAAATEPSTTIFVAHNDYEVIYEIGLFASHDGQKPVRIYSQNAQLIRDFGPRYPYLLLAENEAQVSQLSQGKHITLLRGRQQAEYQHLKMTELKPAARLFSSPQPGLWWYAGTL